MMNTMPPHIDPEVFELELPLFLEAVFAKYHYDFREYARASLRRRLGQALIHFGCRSLSGLQERILHDKALFPELLGFLTVQVSDMFRDPTYFRSLRERVIPVLRTYPSLRIWIAGCSTGEEVWSLAILLREEGLLSRTILYATDINTEALKRAEAGVYPVDRLQAFTQNHQRSGAKGSLSESYNAAYGSAVFDKSLRKNVVFSDHSLATDSVFAEVQLVSCRNVLIYFEPALQERTIRLFSESLVHRGFLGLGSKESLHFSEAGKDFETLVREDRIFQKKAAP